MGIIEQILCMNLHLVTKQKYLFISQENKNSEFIKILS